MFKMLTKVQHLFKFDHIIMILFLISFFRAFKFVVCLEDLDFRLSHDVVPIRYVLQLHPDFQTELFSGEVTITIQTFKQKRFIAIHAKDLTIRSVRLSTLKISNWTSEVDGDVSLKNLFVVDKFDMLVIETTSNISIGHYRLRFEFHGIMSKNNKGFFIRNFPDAYSNNIRKIAMTQFEPTYARHAFPCFDEPEFKTVFEISVVQPNIEGYHSLSNMPVQHSTQGIPLPGLTTVYFERTWPISTYVVGLIVTDLVNQTALLAKRWESLNLIPLSTWTTIEKKVHLDLALHITYRSLDLYMRLFHLNYPLPKIDLIAIPGFIFGPVENWGLVFYDEPSMLYFSRSHSITDLKIATNRITYGLVQMWFGNLVTMNWWSDVWLRKSFAMYMQYYTTTWLFPDWKETECFLVDAKFPSMERDALISSLPIVQSTGSSIEILQYTNSIFQKKGASIIRMLYYMMGDSNFFLGVANFMRVFRYNSALPKDFLWSLQKYYDGKESLIRFVETWTDQSGFPVLKVERIDKKYYISQSRFLLRNNVTTYDPLKSPYSYKWDLPIFYTTNISNGTKIIFLPHKANKAEFRVSENVTWVKFNANSIGYYTVNYDMESWNIFLEILQNKPQVFHHLDRVDLMNDAFFNADAGNIPFSIPMSILESMKFWASYTFWQLVSDRLLRFHTILRNTEITKDYEAFVRNLIRSMYALVGWSSSSYDSFEYRRLRVVILGMTCAMQMEESIAAVKDAFRNWIADPDCRPHPDVKELIYHYGMLYAGKKRDWDIVYQLFVAEPNLQERHRLMISLTAIQRSDILIRYLEISKNLEVMSTEEYLMTLYAAVSNPLDPIVVWNFYKTNWNFLSTRYSEHDIEFARLIIPMTSKFRDNNSYKKIVEFFEKNPCGKLRADARKEALETIRNNIIWMEKRYREFKNWLDDCHRKKISKNGGKK